MEVARLIINADDFGLTEPINRGIIETIENGIVNSVSLIANGIELKSACDYARSKHGIFKGWHINLTTGKPVLDPVKVKSLVDGNGYFLGKNRFVIKALAGKIDANECRMELLMQMDKLVKNKIRITHIDSHHDIHYLRFIANILSPILQRLECKYIRFHKSHIKFLRNFVLFSQIDKVLIKQHAKRILYKNNYNLIDFIWFRELYQQKDKLKTLKSYISAMKSGVNLVTCHPGYYDEKNELKLKYNHQRQEEMKTLCNPDFFLLLNKYNIELIFNNNI